MNFALISCFTRLNNTNNNTEKTEGTSENFDNKNLDES